MTGANFNFIGHAGGAAHAEGRPVTVATDAAVNQKADRAGTGFVTTAGWYGVSGHPNPAAIIGREVVVVAELQRLGGQFMTFEQSR